MSKRAEQAALKAYPVDICGYRCGCEIGDKPEPLDYNERQRIAYQEAYEQAEKDLALTWEDIRAIDELLTLVYDPDNEEGYYTKVLEEFNKRRKVK